MMGFVEMNDEQTPPDGLSQSADILLYLSKAGNKAALRRLDELKQFCSHVWSPERLEGEWKWLKNESTPGSGPASNPHLPADPGSGSDAAHVGPSNKPQVGTALGNNSLSDWNRSISGDLESVLFNFDSFNDLDIDLSHEMGDIYSSFNDPTLPLTGIDEADWAEIGKIFHLN